MLLIRSLQTASLPRRIRPASPHCRGGASSLLRLAQPGAARLPTALDLSGWMGRAASVLMPVTRAQTAFAASEFGSGSAGDRAA